MEERSRRRTHVISVELVHIIRIVFHVQMLTNECSPLLMVFALSAQFSRPQASPHRSQSAISIRYFYEKIHSDFLSRSGKSRTGCFHVHDGDDEFDVGSIASYTLSIQCKILQFTSFQLMFSFLVLLPILATPPLHRFHFSRHGSWSMDRISARTKAHCVFCLYFFRFVRLLHFYSLIRHFTVTPSTSFYVQPYVAFAIKWMMHL